MLASADAGDDVTTWSLPVVTGRVIGAIVRDPEVDSLAGGSHRIRELAARYGIADVHYPGAQATSD